GPEAMSCASRGPEIHIRLIFDKFFLAIPVPNGKTPYASLTRTKETAISLAERCSVHRLAVAAHVAIVEADLVGIRLRRYEMILLCFHCLECIDAGVLP
ncbi:hypothetical protein PWR63_26865, partial [Paraburkholderia sp. A2WS-5]|uniref:hypothetical protein n=1 Tax=unclassified Paraburkholderia TaxID=2615204 RepID=UPI003B763881